MTCGIYSIKCLESNKQYIGSSCDIERRWIHHRSYLNNNKHTNNRLQTAWNKHSKDKFDFKILTICNYADLSLHEQRFIDYYKPRYNLSLTVEGFGIGEDSPVSKLTNQQVIDIYKSYINNLYLTQSDIADKYKVNIETIGRIVRGHSWTHLQLRDKFGAPKNRVLKPQSRVKMVTVYDHPMSNLKRAQVRKRMTGNKFSSGYKHTHETREKMSISKRGEHNGRSKLTEDNVIDILRTYFKKHKTVIEIASQFKVGLTTIYMIIKNQTWKHINRNAILTEVE